MRSRAAPASANGKRLSIGSAIGERRLALPIDSRFPLAEAGAALERMSANQHFGKIVLTV